MTFKEALAHPWLTIRVQIALGAIFVAAALPKIADPPSFAHMIYNYRILPGALVNLSALVMPWVEILAGLALIAGVWVKPARWLIAAMLVVFIVAIGFNLWRGNAIDCGCFDLSAAAKTYEERIYDMWVVIVRDIGMLLMCAQLAWAGRFARKDAVE
ncbi:MAG TPA: MauE/DoxX family redox-associated membrane protein [Thermoanaerobaculia bacterium]|nr:MauE/DoxX family redox-associated membrane protein [Thermoanaerobaculia bacterium]